MPKLLFKIIGLGLLLLCCTALGFLKANALKYRLEALQKIKNGFLSLKELIRLHNGDKTQLINKCFPDVKQLMKYLDNQDQKLWNEFLSVFGSGDTKNEYERCLAFISLFDSKISNLSKETAVQQKLYKSLGFFSGLFLCIFFF